MAMANPFDPINRFYNGADFNGDCPDGPTEPEIAAVLGGHPTGRGFMCRCPSHEDRRPAWRSVTAPMAGCWSTAMPAARRRR